MADEWKFDGDSSRGRFSAHCYVRTHDLGHILVECVCVRNDAGEEDVAAIEEAKRQAHLVSAAPELLAVALMVLDTATVETPQALIDAATAAVRKAAPGLLRPTPEQALATCGDD